MSFIVSFTHSTETPAQDDAAWQYLEDARERDRNDRNAKSPDFMSFLERITKHFPCITKLPDDKIDDGVWTDGPIEFNAGKETMTLGILSQYVANVMMEVKEIARNLKLVIFLHMTDQIIRP